VQLFHLREPLTIAAVPSSQSIAGLERQATAIWAAVTRACILEDFRPKPGPGCEWCGFHAYCPAMGGDLALAQRAAGHQDEQLAIPPTLFDAPSYLASPLAASG
ncbi:MAG TPA: hypothetical protein VME46_03155, partial [Acidimicrobiales bacterium]|nr:hypothetical protein [Acidimicrobiales bacterium]